ncbi:selenide, water dikinase SelD [Listeria monocytogenes]|uniref:selenide, water dikinase SelD n=1 Tax=Listeria innocua TaxID=1642 RepID=UPI0016271811|nr:selenide, water dikinase SelD [Listeria innocua]EKP7339220.1 selenide, water dikinase SelD [Listeria monocytogenes]MBC1385459.1 selenide, water dikinase SelD [Listeria innocua]MBC1925973.1 selenide, water dikinase SelD [Listeria innocua]
MINKHKVVVPKEELIICGGCNAKIGPGHLDEILQGIPKTESDSLLVGFDTADDAAVIKLSEEQALIQTLDFFPTMVSDPYLFGKIAAANALSDVYAMGGKVLSAMNIVCFPEDENLAILKEIIRGGAEKVKEAGGILVGGHSIHDASVKYGLSVTGTIHPNKLLRNNNCQLGDHLILTKPLGVGIITTAYSVGEMDQKSFDEAVGYMQTLNKDASEIIGDFQVSSCTDITGFGLLGHLHELLHGAFSACLFSSKIPVLAAAKQAANEFLLTAGGQRNRNHLESFVHFEQNDFGLEEILFDPQTSGGLLVSIPAAEADQLVAALQEAKIPAADFGKVTTKDSWEIRVK